MEKKALIFMVPWFIFALMVGYKISYIMERIEQEGKKVDEYEKQLEREDEVSRL